MLGFYARLLNRPIFIFKDWLLGITKTVKYYLTNLIGVDRIILSYKSTEYTL